MQRNSYTCTNCGYELTGLPAIGRCPECGQEFNQYSEQGALNTARHNTLADWINNHVRSLTIALLSLFVLTCIALVSLATGLASLRTLYILLILAAVSAFVLAVSYLDERHR